MTFTITNHNQCRKTKDTSTFNYFEWKDLTLRDDYIEAAQKIIPDPNILINVVSRRVKQLKYNKNNV